MKSIREFLFILCVLNALLACSGGDSSDNSGNTSKNDNANNTYAYREAGRLEIPHLKGGTSLFIVHSTAAFGVNYCVEWDCTKKSQRWTAYEMYASNSVANWNRNNWYNTSWEGDPFQADPSIPAAYRTELSDYRYTGYNRGHLCPSADRLCSQDANEQTFYLSNMQPQKYEFNSGIWEKMENQVRTWNKSSFRDTLYVVKGGTMDFQDQIYGFTSTGLIVPQYFYMAILCKNAGGYKAIAFWVDHFNHNSTSVSDYVLTSIDELERRTNIDFFCNLPDDIETKVESATYMNSWGLQ